MTSVRNGARLLVECLVKQGVEFIFAIPGAKIDAVFDALVDAPIELILCRHEQNAAFMAAAYGRLTGKPGVVLVTSGPGVANLTTGLLTATTEGDPIVAIGGNVSQSMKLKASHQNTDNIKLMEAVTKARMEVAVVDSIPEIIENAFRLATLPHSGAVFISLPQDVGLQETSLNAPDPLPPVVFGAANASMIEQAVKYIYKAKNPVLFLGEESSRPINSIAIQKLISKTKIPVVCTYQAAGVVSHELFEYFVGRVGLFKNQPGDILLNRADLIITIGFNPVEYDPETWNKSGNADLIHINYDIAAIRQGYFPVIELCGDIALTLDSITEMVTAPTSFNQDYKKLSQELIGKIDEGKTYETMPIHPLRFIHALRSILNDEAIVITDVGSNYMWMARYFLSFKPHHLLFSNGQQTLGIALPWAIAAKLAHPDKTIVSISGDGGFLFSAMELETAVRKKVHFVHFVWVDGSYNMVKEQQLEKYHRESCVELGPVDIVKFAESFGARGYKVTSVDQLVPIINAALSENGPVLVEIPIDYKDNLALFEKVIGEIH
jgi:acetolactate synthase-1/2/3 large subunit